MPSANEITTLYIATFNRAPDADGLHYWEESGLDIESIAASFFDQPETQELYPPQTGTEEFINAVYNNLFNRSAEPEGLAYWKEQLDSGAVSRHHFILALINGALNDDFTILQNKTTAGLLYVEYGLNNLDIAHEVIDIITVDPASIDEAEALIAQSETSTLLDQAYENFSYTNLLTASLPTADTYGVAALDSGMRWGDDIHTLTYTFPDTMPNEYEGILSDWAPLPHSVREAVRTLLDGIEEIVDLQFIETQENGEIRFNLEPLDPIAGYAYYPSPNGDLYGDIFLDKYLFENPNEEWLTKDADGMATIAHELGHALGLKHPFEDETTLLENEDNITRSLMSYNDSFAWHITFEETDSEYIAQTELFAPYPYAIYDIATLQSIYGANIHTRTENNVYRYDFTKMNFITIWDAGGNDTIDLSNNTGASFINLSPGSINNVDFHTKQSLKNYYAQSINSHIFDDWIDNLYDAKLLYNGTDALSIAYGVWIENLITGSGNDIVYDNAVDNFIQTGAGNDALYVGAGGFDTVDGGEGYDTLYLNSNSSDVHFYETRDGLLIEGDNFALLTREFEVAIFTDGTTVELN